MSLVSTITALNPVAYYRMNENGISGTIETNEVGGTSGYTQTLVEKNDRVNSSTNTVGSSPTTVVNRDGGDLSEDGDGNSMYLRNVFSSPYFGFGHMESGTFVTASHSPLDPSGTGLTVFFRLVTPSAANWSSMGNSYAVVLAKGIAYQDPPDVGVDEWQWPDWWITMTSGGTLQWQGFNTGYYGDAISESWDMRATLSASTEYSIAVVISNDPSGGLESGPTETGAKIYINGVEATYTNNQSNVHYGDLHQTNGGLVVGAAASSSIMQDEQTGSTSAFLDTYTMPTGTKISELAIWSTELSSANILAIHNAAITPPPVTEGFSDSMSLSDSTSSLLVEHLESLSDTFSLAENWQTDLTILDTLGLTDTIDMLLVETSYSLSDTVSLSDEVLSIVTENFSSTITLSDLFAGLRVLGLSDTISFTEAWDGTQKWIFSDTIELSDEFTLELENALADSIALSSVFSTTLIQTTKELNDTLALTDGLRWRAEVALTDTFGLSDTITVATAISVIADTLGLSDAFLPIIQKELGISDEFALSDNFSLNHRWELSDALSFTDTVIEKIRQLLSISSTLTLDDSFTHSFSIQLLFADSFSLTDSVEWSIQKVLSFASSIGFIGNFRFDGERYDVWAFNPRTMAVFELDYSMPIKGIGRLAGKNVLVREDGVFEVGGTDDAGEVFDAFLRTGMTDFDDPERHFPGENLKQLLQGYLVHTSTGDTLLKVRTTRRGELIETWFKCRDKPNVMTKSQVPLSNSLRSLLFQFELVPLKSKPAQFHAVEIVPLFLKRSI